MAAGEGEAQEIGGRDREAVLLWPLHTPVCSPTQSLRVLHEQPQG